MVRLLKDLEKKISSYPNKDNRTINKLLFLHSGKKPPTGSDIRVYSLKAAHPGPGLNLKSNFFRRVNRNEVT